MKDKDFWEAFIQASPLQQSLVWEILSGKGNRPQHPMDEDTTIVWNGRSPLENKKTLRRLYRVAETVKPTHRLNSDNVLLMCAGYQLGVKDGKRAERARKKANVERLEPVHADLNTNLTNRGKVHIHTNTENK
jgi:hypothetical protein